MEVFPDKCKFVFPSKNEVHVLSDGPDIWIFSIVNVEPEAVGRNNVLTVVAWIETVVLVRI